MSSQNSINNVLKHIAAYDSEGKSSIEIDTKREYDFLGAYLNGSINIFGGYDDESGEPIVFKYTDLLKDAKQQLFAIMDSLNDKFGEWKNPFAQAQGVTKENAFLYADRLMNFKIKLEELKDNEEVYNKYYSDNKDEIADVENKLRKFCMNSELNINEYDINSLEKLRNTFNNGSYDSKEMQEIRQSIINEGDTFKITREFANKYAYKIEQIINDEDKYIDIYTDEQKNILKEALASYLKIDMPEVTAENVKGYSISWCLNDANTVYAKFEKMDNCNEKIQSAINTSHVNELRIVVDKYIKDNNTLPLTDIPDGIDIGNGLFDKTSTQKTENCWAHAGINSLLPFDEGKKLLENNYYRDKETGIIAIHLQEAEDLGLHGGVYIVTPQEIIDSQETLASGEGEISAYIIAIQKYFDEVNSNTELKSKNENKLYNNMDEGNYGFRFYEIITGGKYTEWKYYDLDSNKIRKGIATSTSFDMNDMYKMVENGQGTLTISLRGIAHNISIVGVKDNKFLIQESNNSETIFDNHVGIDDERIFTVEERIYGRPTYGISIETANKYSLGAINYIKWE